MIASGYRALRLLRPMVLLAGCLLLTGMLSAASCIPSTDGPDGDGDRIDPNNPPITEGSWYRPAVTATWQWQLQPDATDNINMTYDVEVYDIDLFDVSDSVLADLHAQGRKVIAYFSAGTYEPFRSDADGFQASEIGNTLEDFADERWLDIRSENVRQIMLARLDYAVLRGFDGVEPDNVDGYANNSGFPLTAVDQLAFNRFIANAAHERNLAVGLKNDLDQITELVQYFDFAVNEQCHQYDECDALEPFIDAGKPVFSAEYADVYVNLSLIRNQMCADSLALGLRTLVLPVDLDDSFRFSCDP